ncbi:MAG: integrase core domain-containing protein, partial [Chitinispirillia bacterium]
KILRSKIDGQIKLTDYDRMLLVKYGMPIKDRLYEFISIVKPDTLLAWNRKMKNEKWTYDNSPKSSGRRRKNSYAERFVKESRETLDNLILFGERHLRLVLKKIEKHHNEYRPHQGIGNTIPLKYNYPNEPVSKEDIKCEQILGGLLNHYYVDKKAS